jgi:hypothetical protein
VVEVVRKALPQADLTGTAALSQIGAHDPFGRHGPLLEAWLLECSADLDAHYRGQPRTCTERRVDRMGLAREPQWSE